MSFTNRLSRLLFPERASVFSAKMRPERPFCVIGDIHGCDGLLEQVLQRIAERDDCRAIPILFLGDYIDRGDASAGVLRRLYRAQTSQTQEVVCLQGNHEDMMLGFLDDPERNARLWLNNGGLQTLASFQIEGISQNLSGEHLLRVRDQLLQAVGENIIAWLRTLPTHWASGNMNVVHAGADPHVDLKSQLKKTLLWGHPDFLKTPRSDGQWVIHGHTIVHEVMSESGRIAVDTGAYATGRLSAIRVCENGIEQIFP